MDSATLSGPDWPYVLDLLPSDLEESAVSKLAMVRKRGITSAADLLRLCLAYACCDFSLRQVASQAALLGTASISDVAVMKRLQKAGDWLGYLVVRFLQERGLAAPDAPFRVRVVDATTVSEPGSQGTDWRLHVGLDLARQQISSVELTGPAEGETFRRHTVAPGEIVLGDRGYAHRRGLAHILAQQAHVVVRFSGQNLPLQTRQGHPLDPLVVLQTLQPGEIGDWPVQFESDAQTYPMRLVALRKSAAAAAQEERRMRRDASRKSRRVSAKALQAAHFVYLLTDLGADEAPADQVLELYRLRWQIEIVFKRLKSLLHLDHLRAKNPELARAYLYAKILGALLVEELACSSLSFFPWGYRLSPQGRQSLALAADTSATPAGRGQGCADD